MGDMGTQKAASLQAQTRFENSNVSAMRLRST
jgi:hypothetical protein